MKLWQKVFLITLTLVTLAINVNSFVISYRSQKHTLEIEKENIKNTCELLVSKIETEIMISKKEKGVLFVGHQEIFSKIKNIIEIMNSDRTYIDIKVSEKKIDWIEEINDEEKVYSIKFESIISNKYYIKAEVPMIIDGYLYNITISKDITYLFELFDDNITYLQCIGIFSSVCIAIVLLIVICFLMKPLIKINEGTKNIANGNYNEKINIRGTVELVELATNMNGMSRKIQEKIDEIEKLSSNRKRFIANMTHELKTPLTSIMGFSDILKIKATISEEERREYAAIISSESQRLRMLSSKLMELISIDEVKLELKKEEIETVIFEVIENMNPIFEANKIIIQTSLQQSSIFMDKTLFMSLIYNVLENAVKASSEGDIIEVKIQVEEKEVHIWVTDHGIGIEDEKIALVTEPFYMVDKSRTRKAGGYGIGLALCMEITKAHYGRVEIKSRPARGTSVKLSFPLDKERNMR